MSGFVQRRGPSRYKARHRAPDGRERSKTFARKADADRWLVTQEADKARGAWVDPALGRVTFASWAQEWLGLQAALKPKTRAGYDGILRTRLLPRFGPRGLASIQPVEIRRFIADLQADGIAPRTIRNTYRVLHAVMGSAVENRRIGQNPCVGVSLPAARRRDMLVLTAEQVEQLAAWAGDAGPLIMLAAYSGLRWGEIAALRVSRVDTMRGTVDVAESVSEVGQGFQFVAPKNGRSRTVRLPRGLVEILTPALAGKAPTALVFPSVHGEPMRHGHFYGRVLRPAVAAAGLSNGFRFHDLRHTCAALLIAQGAHPRAIMERLGHSSITVTMDTYGHLLPSIDEGLAAGLDATLRAAREAHAASMRPARPVVVPLVAGTRVRPAETVEAGTGIEPVCEVLQTSWGTFLTCGDRAA
jgi:integrase